MKTIRIFYTVLFAIIAVCAHAQDEGKVNLRYFFVCDEVGTPPNNVPPALLIWDYANTSSDIYAVGETGTEMLSVTPAAVYHFNIFAHYASGKLTFVADEGYDVYVEYERLDSEIAVYSTDGVINPILRVQVIKNETPRVLTEPVGGTISSNDYSATGDTFVWKTQGLGYQYKNRYGTQLKKPIPAGDISISQKLTTEFSTTFLKADNVSISKMWNVNVDTPTGTNRKQLVSEYELWDIYDYEESDEVGVYIKCYKQSDFTKAQNGFTEPNTNATPIKTIHLYSDDLISRKVFYIQEYNTGMNIIINEKYQYINNESKWQKVSMNSSNQNLYHKDITRTESGNTTTIISQVYDNTVNPAMIIKSTKLTNKKYTLQNGSIIWRTIEKIEDYGETTQGYGNFTTTYAYYEDNTDVNSYTNLKHVINPDGSWKKYAYTLRGAIRKIYEPIGNTPTHPDEVTVDDSNSEALCKVSEYEYIFSTTRTSEHIYIGNKTLKKFSLSDKITIRDDYDSPFINYNSKEYNGSIYLIGKKVFSGYTPYPDYTWPAGKTASETFADKSKINYYYPEMGYVSSPRELTMVYRTGLDFYKSEVTVHGSSENVAGSVEIEDMSELGNPFSAGWVYYTNSMQNIFLKPNESIIKIKVYAWEGPVIYEVEYLFTYNNGVNGLQEIAWTQYDYDELNRLVKRTDHVGNVYECYYSPTTGLKEYEIDESGIRTDYLYNFSGLVSSKTVAGVSAYADSDGTFSQQPSITTYYEYDGLGRLLRSYTPTSSGTLNTYYKYDRLGRVEYEQLPCGKGYQYIYRVADGLNEKESRQVRLTIVNHRITGVAEDYGIYEVTAYNRDETLKSVTGTAVIPEYYTYNYNPSAETGLSSELFPIAYTTTVKIGSESSTRSVTTAYDLLGNVAYVKEPTTSSGTHKYTQYIYATDTNTPGTGRLKKVLNSGVAPTLFTYDWFGNLVSSGLDVNNNGILDAASMDRITIYANRYMQESGAWWYESQSLTYSDNNSSSKLFSSGRTKTRIYGGFTGGLVSEAISYPNQVLASTTDYWNLSNTNPTTAKTYIDRSSTKKKVKSVITPPELGGSTITTISVNGKSVIEKSPTGAIGYKYYDSLGRLNRTLGERGVETKYFYLGATSNVERVQMKNSSGAFVNVKQYGYCDCDCERLSYEIDANGKYTRYDYNKRGQVTRIWGDGVQPVVYEYNQYGEKTKMYTFKDGNNLIGNQVDWPLEASAITTYGSKTEWVYDAATGLLKEKIDHSGSRTRYHYDTQNRLKFSVLNRYHYGPSHNSYPYSGYPYTHYYYHSSTGELLGKDYHLVSSPSALPNPSTDKADGMTSWVHYAYNRLGLVNEVTDAIGHRDWNESRKFTYDETRGYQLDKEQFRGKFYGEKNGSTYTDLVLDYSYDTYNRYTGYKLGISTDADKISSLVWAYKPTTGLPDYAEAYHFNNAQTTRKRRITYTYIANSSILDHTNVNNVLYSPELKHDYGYETHRNFANSLQVSLGAPTVTQAQYSFYRDDQGKIYNIEKNGPIFYGIGSLTSTNSTHKLLEAYTYNSRGELDGAATYVKQGSTYHELHDRTRMYYYDKAGNRVAIGERDWNNEAYYDSDEPGLDQYPSIQELQYQFVRGWDSANPPYYFDFDTNNTSPYDYFSDGWVSAEKPNNQGSYYWLQYDQLQTNNVRYRHLYNNQTGQTESYLVPWSSDPQDRWKDITYDADGNITYDGNYSFYYDAENRLIRVNDGFIWIEYRYDYMNRRVEQSVFNVNGSGGKGGFVKRTRYLYKGFELIAEFAHNASTNAATAEKTYSWGLDVSGTAGGAGGIGGLWMIAEKTLANFWYPSYDGRGNITALFHQPHLGTTTRVAEFDYDPFGQTVLSKATNATHLAACPFRWQTKWSMESGLESYSPRFGLDFYDFGLRWYSIEQGRFLNRDPIGEAGGNNLYGYVGNDPINAWDLLGMERFCYNVTTEWESFKPYIDGGGSINYHSQTKEYCTEIPDSYSDDGWYSNGNYGGSSGGSGGNSDVSSSGKENAWDAERRKKCEELVNSIKADLEKLRINRNAFAVAKHHLALMRNEGQSNLRDTYIKTTDLIVAIAGEKFGDSRIFNSTVEHLVLGYGGGRDTYDITSGLLNGDYWDAVVNTAEAGGNAFLTQQAWKGSRLARGAAGPMLVANASVILAEYAAIEVINRNLPGYSRQYSNLFSAENGIDAALRDLNKNDLYFNYKYNCNEFYSKKPY